MYGKLFESMFDGTLRRNWKAAVVFQQMIIFCNPDGVFDMTPEALHYRTGIPLDMIEKGIKVLEMPDPESRSPAEEGRRIVRISDERDWGWQIVNHAYYRDIQRAEDRRQQNRDRQQRFRDKKKPNNEFSSRSVTARNAPSRMSRHTDTDSDTERGRASRFAPKDFKPTEEMEDWALSQGLLSQEIVEETEKFKDYERSKPIKNWNMAWRNWIRKGKEFRRERAGESVSVTTVDYAAELGLTQNPGEAEDHFKIRVRDAMIAHEYGSA